MNKILMGAVLGSTVMISACAITSKITMTPMQIQAMQQREYETDKASLFASAVSVFQDLGYQVQGADLETGFINARSNSENSTNFFEAWGGGVSSKQTQATAFVEQFTPARARIRLNFVEAKSSSSFYGSGQSTSDSLLNPEIYRNAFERIDEALFVRGAAAQPAAVHSAPAGESLVEPPEG